MSKNQEFDHGTGHKFDMTKERAGIYNSCCGIQVSSRLAYGYPGGKTWDLKYPGQTTPDESVRTLRDATAHAESVHNPNKESNRWVVR
jgi:hypothetical protein